MKKLFRFLPLLICMACAPSIVVKGPHGGSRRYPQKLVILVLNQCASQGTILIPGSDSLVSIPRGGRSTITVPVGLNENPNNIVVVFDGRSDEAEYVAISQKFSMPRLDATRYVTWILIEGTKSSRRPIRCTSQVR